MGMDYGGTRNILPVLGYQTGKPSYVVTETIPWLLARTSEMNYVDQSLGRTFTFPRGVNKLISSGKINRNRCQGNKLAQSCTIVRKSGVIIVCRCGNAVHEVNPELLIIVEGLNYATDLTEVKYLHNRIVLTVSNLIRSSWELIIKWSMKVTLRAIVNNVAHNYAWDYPAGTYAQFAGQLDSAFGWINVCSTVVFVKPIFQIGLTKTTVEQTLCLLFRHCWHGSPCTSTQTKLILISLVVAWRIWNMSQ